MLTAVRGYLVSWRVALRIARRTAVRSRARSLLVLAMIALPVYAGTVIAVVNRTTAAPWQTQARWRLGAADAVLHEKVPDATDTPPTAGDFGLVLPAGAHLAPSRRWFSMPVVTPHGTITAGSWAIDLADPLAAGRFRMLAGHAPRAAEEVALSARLAAATHTRIGDTVRLGRPEQRRTVVAVVDEPSDLSDQFVVTASSFPVPGRRGLSTAGLAVDLPGRPGPAAISGAFAHCDCPDVVTRESFRPSPQPVRLSDLGPPLLIIGFAVAEVALLAGAAFAVGARRQTRELGLIAATGGNSRQVARVVLGGGIVLGTVAGMTGAAAGVVTVAAGHPVVQRLANHVVDHTVVRFGELAGIVAVAVFAGLVAAVLPARGVARQPVLAALTGRRSGSGGSRRMMFAGIGAAGAGVAVTALGAAPPSRIDFVTAGSVLGLVGIVLCAPALVGVAARLAGWLPLSARLALRDGGRHRNRTGAAVAAVTAAVAGSMALNLYLASQDDANHRRPTQLRLGQGWIGGDPAEIGRLTVADLAPVASALPVRDTLVVRDSVVVPDVTVDPASGTAPMTLSVWGADGQPAGIVAVGDARLVRAITHRAVPARVSQALDGGGAVVVQPGVGIHHGGITLAIPAANGSSTSAELPAVTLRADRHYPGLPVVVIGEQAARRLALHPVSSFFLLDTTRMPTRAEERAASTALDDTTERLDVAGFAGLSVQRPYSSDLAVTLMVLVGISGLVTLLATGIAVGLAIAESRDDLSTLAAVGAAPRVRRVLSAAQAGVIAGLGTMLGLVGGTLPAAGLVGMDQGLRFVVPWGYLPLFLVVPVLAALLSGAVTRSRLTLVRRLS